MPKGRAVPGPKSSRAELLAAVEALQHRVEELEQEKNDLEVMLETTSEHADNLSKTLEEERNDLAMMLEMATEHADVVEEELHGQAEVLADKSTALEQLSNKLSKYLSPQVYDSISHSKQEIQVASTRKKMTVFFSDIVGFTETTDKMESEDLTLLLNQYLTEMSQIALDHGATIDKYIGDAIMIFFGDPESRGVKEDALACVRMAIAMQKRMKILAASWRHAGIEKPLACRIGIHTGYCTVGNFGSEDRMDYTIIGGTVNLASRLEHEASHGGILISYETYAHVKDEVKCEPAGQVQVKGLAYPITTYQVLDHHENLSANEQPIDSILLQEICEQIAAEIDAIVSIFAQHGEIVASSTLERIGKFHEGGEKIMTGEADLYETTADDAAKSEGMMEGVTLPIEFDGERVFCVALAAPLDVARQYGRIVQYWVVSHLKAAKRRSSS